MHVPSSNPYSSSRILGKWTTLCLSFFICKKGEKNDRYFVGVLGAPDERVPVLTAYEYPASQGPCNPGLTSPRVSSAGCSREPVGRA